MKAIGRVTGHPDGKLAMLFPLLKQADYFTLGLPPSFETITRDVYAEATVFSVSFVVTVLRSIAEACFHLHSQSIMHGDIYAHNVLSRRNGVSLLTDFGAASLPGEYFGADVTKRLEKIEVRAFGCLIDDLISHVGSLLEDKASDVIRQIESLSIQCLDTDLEKRPTFQYLVHSLNQIVLI